MHEFIRIHRQLLNGAFGLEMRYSPSRICKNANMSPRENEGIHELAYALRIRFYLNG